MDISNRKLALLSQFMGDQLYKRNYTLSAAESCTGGWLTKCCTDIKGSSAWFDCGFITYSNQSKQRLLNVKPATLEKFGAVSEQTVMEMAQGAYANSTANISIAITGIAGPTGGLKDKPVGTVCFAVVTQSCAKIETHYFEGDRDTIRRQAVSTALQLITKNARA